MLLLIDNYDSFTWNLVQRIGEIDPSLRVEVVRNDKITPEEAAALEPTHILISPGPCSPTEAGVSNEIVARFAGRIPILGVCLGHQCIGFSSGMTVARAPRVMHGKTSPVHHDGKGIYAGMSNPFVATRYHSLVVLRDTVPAQGWEVSAWTIEHDERATSGRREVVMGLRRAWQPADLRAGLPGAPLEGVQFHPESFLTVEGPMLLANFLGRPAPVRDPERVGPGAGPGARPGPGAAPALSAR